MSSTYFIFRQLENLVDNQKCQAGFRPLCNKILRFDYFYSCGRCKWAPKKKYDPVFRHVYNAHREDVSNGLKIRCLLCQNDEVFMNTSAEFNKHMTQKHCLKYQKYRCSYCRFGTESARNLLCHKKFQHPSLPHYACDYCPTKFFNEDTKNRYLIHTSDS